MQHLFQSIKAGFSIFCGSLLFLQLGKALLSRRTDNEEFSLWRGGFLGNFLFLNDDGFLNDDRFLGSDNGIFLDSDGRFLGSDNDGLVEFICRYRTAVSK